MDKIKEKIKQLEEQGCSCDLLYGYRCDIHQLAVEAINMVEEVAHANSI